MSVPIKRLQELARRIPASERRTVEKFMECVIADSDEQLTADEISMIRTSQEEIARGEVDTWKPGMFTKSKSPKPAANKSNAHRVTSRTPLKKPSQKSPPTLVPNPE